MSGMQGVKVIDLTAYAAGPGCSRIFGELGATVIKVEPFTGDEQRTQGMAWGMQFKTEFDDVAYDCGSFNKEWTAINLKSEEGSALMQKMISDADILITSFRDSALERLGLDYETLHEKYPKLVWGQLRGYGERGPLKDAKGFDATSYSARGGINMSFPNAGEGFQPANAPIAFGDWNASNALSVGVLAAYSNALRTGEGDKVVTSLYHVATWGMTCAVIAQQQGCDHPKNRKEAKCPTNNSYCSSDDVWFLICFGHYNKYCPLVFETIGLDHLINDPEYNTLEALAANGKYVEVVAQMEEAFKKRPFSEWEPIFLEKDIPFQKCFTVNDVLEDEEAFANDQLRKVHYEDQGYGEDKTYTITTAPFRLKSMGDPVLYRSRPIGYDTRKIMKEHGYSEDQINAMIENGDVLEYTGDPVPEVALQPNYGPNSPR
ncbi:MAG: CaiB/BaiF CoA transferase family protein [Raoultibacter sp.]|jgi:crotonobetainyl-CoA:carnitine CoA-transferase CaiB-like acyl-CoA transferase